ncbi:MAG: hypothetical protein VR64_15770 [Desulfatitalea sp. BRH_c12]|nr:MAG: hypothetical protein VR64_15770 [Desulfatitalea sp. BRH_c12]
MTKYHPKRIPDQYFPYDESGSALIVCLLVLVVLTTLGIMAAQTSVTEIKISGNEQQWIEDLNTSEGGAQINASKVGFARTGAYEWYEIANPEQFDQILVPPSADYDPGGDIKISGTFPKAFNDLTRDEQVVDKRYWPHENLLQDATDDRFDYAYLVTYLGASDKALKGYNAGSVAAYKFRVNGVKQVAIELGGMKIGLK